MTRKEEILELIEKITKEKISICFTAWLRQWLNMKTMNDTKIY